MSRTDPELLRAHLEILRAQLDALNQAWARSLEPVETTKIASGERRASTKRGKSDDAEANEDPRAAKVERVRVTQTGDVRYLKEARAVLEEIRALSRELTTATVDPANEAAEADSPVAVPHVGSLSAERRAQEFDRVMALALERSRATMCREGETPDTESALKAPEESRAREAGPPRRDRVNPSNREPPPNHRQKRRTHNGNDPRPPNKRA